MGREDEGSERGEEVDVIVVGAGPAGLSLAAALRRTGLDLRCIAPLADAPWVPVFGIWERDALAAGIEHALSHRWDAVRVVDAAGEERVLPEGYARIDNAVLQRTWLDACGADVMVDGQVRRVTWEDETSAGGRACVELEDGRRLWSRLVVDATGHQGALVKRRLAPDTVWQTAYGFVTRFDSAPWPEDAMVLMDWRPAPGATGTPTFLYAMPLGAGRWFVEETVLAGRPALGHEALRDRLHARLKAMGLTWDGVDEEEFCTIPMAGGTPDVDGPIVAWGSAAGMIHPATGYQLGHVLRWAPDAAAAIAQVLGAGGSGAEAARQVQARLWPPSRRRMWALYTFGVQGLMRMSHEEVGAFFFSFLGGPREDWCAYLSAEGDAGRLAGVMQRFYTRTSWGIRMHLTGMALRPSGLWRLQRAARAARP